MTARAAKLMPFNPTNVVHVLPSLREPVRSPVIPERGGGGPRRVHVEITVHPPSPPRRRSSVLWWLVALLAVALAVH
jgi:hypothetical protein